MKFYPNLTFYIGNIEYTFMAASDSSYSEPIFTHTHGKHIYEIYYIKSGKGYIHIGNDQQKHVLESGTFGFNGASLSHSQYPAGDSTIKDYNITLSIKPSTKQPASAESRIGQAILDTPHWIGYNCEYALPVFKRIIEELQNQHVGHEIVLKALCKELCVLLVRSFSSDPMFEKKNYCYPDLNSNRQIIIDDILFKQNDTITLDSLAEQLECSPRHASRYINLYYGKSFNELKNDFRMSFAVAKLHDFDKPIRDISDELGFSSYDYFDKVFRKHFTLSPSDYRKKLQEEHEQK